MAESKFEVADRPRVGRGKIRAAMNQFIHLMVDGLTLPATDGGRLYDLIVVGGGSAGLAAAMEAARAGVDTLFIERLDVDETGGVVQCVRCCPDIPGWLGGRRPGDPAVTKSKCFNLEILTGREVTSVRTEEHWKVIGTDGGKEYRAKAILLSPGARYRGLKVPGEEHFIGAGIHHCAGCEGPAYAGQEIVVVGSGDLGGIEEALSLGDYASKVTVLEPSDRLMCGEELAEMANKHIKVEVKLNSEVLEFKGDDQLRDNRLSSVIVKDLHSGKIEVLLAAAVFVFMGADPNTEFVRGVVELDPWGFIKTGGKTDRDFQTGLEGVYVVGDARSTSATGDREAVEEGVAVVSAIRQFLERTKVRHG